MEKEKNEIKAIIFDIGGVLFKETMDDIYPRLSKIFGYNLDEFNKVRKKHFAYVLQGKLSSNKYLRAIAKELNINFFKKYKDNWIKIRTKYTIINKDVEKTVIKLKKNYLIGTLTDIILLHNKIRLKKNAYKHFKVKVISCKVGYRKPDPRIYKILIKKLKKYNISPKETIFIDDLKHNLTPAKKMGMKVILFKDNAQLTKDLKKLGVKLK